MPSALLSLYYGAWELIVRDLAQTGTQKEETISDFTQELSVFFLSCISLHSIALSQEEILYWIQHVHCVSRAPKHLALSRLY